MDLTAAQLAWLRSEVGTRLTDADLQAKYDRLGSVRDVAIESLRERRAKLLDSPLAVSIDGVANVNQAENVKALERRLTALVQLDDDPSDNSPVGEDVDGGTGVSDRVETFRLTRSRGR